MRPALIASLLRLLCVTALTACAAPSTAGRTEEFALQALNGSGVEGRVTLVELSPDRTRVEIEVEDAGNPSMPAHIHPGSCAELVPQPKYALEQVIDGRSTTEVAAGIDQLLGGNQALNLHRSNDAMDDYTACVDLS
jgi:hypothetical protein